MKNQILVLCFVAFIGYCNFVQGAAKVDGAQIDLTNSPSINFAGIQGNGEVVRVAGRGFNSFGSVQCVWNDIWVSPSATITSDNTVSCFTPQINPANVESLPLTTTMQLIFDGDLDKTFKVSDNFVFGPEITSITPNNGFVAGGNTITIKGHSFDDLTPFTVFFDSVPAASARLISDAQINCVVPPGVFDKDAVVSIVFANKYVALSKETYHYGPQATTISTSCSAIGGGTLVIVQGNNFNDPIVSPLSQPPSSTEVEIVLNNRRYKAVNVVFSVTNGVSFITPPIPDQDAFGKPVEIFIFFKKVADRVIKVPNSFHYGAVMYKDGTQLGISNEQFQALTPVTGHRGGGDSITILGCGFSTLSKSQISVLIGTSETDPTAKQELCFRGAGPGGAGDSLTVVTNGNLTNDRIECFTASVECTSANADTLTRKVEVQLRPGLSAPFQPTYTLPDTASGAKALSYTPGPIVEKISTNQGNWQGNEVITFTGKHFFSTISTAVWGVRAVFSNTALNGTVTSFTGTGKIDSDTSITVTTPTNALFGFTGKVQLFFVSVINPALIQCSNLPRSIQVLPPGATNTTTVKGGFPFSFGATCDKLDVFAHVSGGQEITINGSGFLQNRVNASFTQIRLCLRRLNNATSCNTFEPVVAPNGATASPSSSPFIVSDKQIKFVIPSSSQGVNRAVGSNRLFGDIADVNIFFNDYSPANTSPIAPNANSVHCGTISFTPKIRTVTPNKGSINGHPAFVGVRQTETATIIGEQFDDPVFGKNVAVAIGTLKQNQEQVSTSTSLTFSTRYGAIANTNEDVKVIFNTCNATVDRDSVQKPTMHWGPAIRQIIGPFGLPGLSSSSNTNNDIWGLLPSGKQVIFLEGDGFEEFARFECFIDGIRTPSRLVVANGTLGNFILECTTPARPFGTNATVAVLVDNLCGDKAGSVNYKARIEAQQRVHYTPRIDSLSVTRGDTSGRTQTVVSGEGFIGWSTYECFFGHYTDGVKVVPANNGTQVTCFSPAHRGEFNTDVTVHIELTDPQNTDTFHWKVIAPVKFHYGPVCNDVSVNNGRLAGNNTVKLLGQGFQDCATSNRIPFRNCIFRQAAVYFIDPDDNSEFEATFTNSDTLALPNTITSYDIQVPTALHCMWRPIVRIHYPDVRVRTEAQKNVTCVHPTREYFYHYGPLFQSQSSTFHRNRISYGWASDKVTITGFNFADPGILNPIGGTVKCIFEQSALSTTAIDTKETVTTVPAGGAGDGVGAGIIISDNQVECTIPSPAVFDATYDIRLDWETGNLHTCTGRRRSLLADRFHYGPVIDTLTPKRGYVQQQQQITISGFAFQCCGISQYACAFPSGNINPAALQTGNNTRAVCNVPANDLIDRQMNNIGLTFFSNNFASSGIGSNSLTLTETRKSLSYLYGPIVTGISPTRINTLSAVGATVTITGEGFADPYFNATFCDFFAQAPGEPNDVGQTAVANSFISDTQIICKVKPYNHRCGAIDNVRPRWRRNCGPKVENTTFPKVCSLRDELGEFYFKTETPEIRAPTERSTGIIDTVLPFFTDAGSAAPVFQTVSYGPSIKSVTVETGAGPTRNLFGSVRSFTSGNLVVNVTIDSLFDFVTIPRDATKSKGSETALCKFGNRYAATPSPINVRANGEYFVTCVVPRGYVGESGEISVIPDPHMNAHTTLLTTGTDFWHWTAHAESVSRSISPVNGGQVIVVEGEGFCRYDAVVCVFGNALLGQSQAIESDIVSDYLVTCVSPPRRAPGIVDLQLQFCNSKDGVFDCVANVTSLPNKKREIAASNAIEAITPLDIVRIGFGTGLVTYAGISDISPKQGPLCGNTRVVVRGAGFSAFQSLRCRFGSADGTGNGAETAATINGDGTVTCVTPDLTASLTAIGGIKQRVSCHSFSLQGVTTQNEVITIPSSFSFEFGIPEILEVRPASASVQRAITVTVVGEYFNAEEVGSRYICRFGDFIPTVGSLALRDLPDDDDDEFSNVILCPTPRFTDDRNIVVGEYKLGIEYPCTSSQNSTINRIPFTFTQEPSVRGIAPDSGFEVGGTLVTVVGENLLGGSKYLCAFGAEDDAKRVVVSASLDLRTNKFPTITCVSPARRVRLSEKVEFSVSIDGGKNFIKSPIKYKYYDVTRSC